jgi:hypothetical protein
MSTPANVAARVRSSVVGIVSPTGRGSGYCALPNGLVVTSLDVVGYEREVQLVLDDGGTVAAAVVRVNVALDVALLMPMEAVALPPIESGREPRLGDSAIAIGRVGAEPHLAQTHIVSTSRVLEGFNHLLVAGPIDDDLRGAPLLDFEGRSLGVLVRPRRARSHGDRNGYRWIGGLVLPNAAFEGGLGAAEGPPNEVLELAPEYGCARCDTIFEPDMDRCLECGILLPHRWSREEPEATRVPPLKGLFAVKAALASMGIPANRARVGARTWRFSPALEGQDDRTQLDLTTDEAGDHLVLRAPVVFLPNDRAEHIYRHLLTQNDESAGLYRLSVFDDLVYLSLFSPTSTVDPNSFPTQVSEFSRVLGRHRASLERAFGAEPAYEHQSD